MRQTFPNESLEGLCALFGVTRQAYYEAQVHERKTTIANALVLGFVAEFRKDIPMLGTRKLFHLIKWTRTEDILYSKLMVLAKQNQMKPKSCILLGY